MSNARKTMLSQQVPQVKLPGASSLMPATSGRELYRIDLFGGLQVQCLKTTAARQAGDVITRFRSQTAGSLLAFLAFHRDRQHSREVLSDMFWPESGQSRQNLNIAVSALRAQLEPEGLPPGSVFVGGRGPVGLNPATVITDVFQFEKLLDAAQRLGNDDPTLRSVLLKEALALYRDGFLPGHYQDWIYAAQERLRIRYHGALVWLARYMAAEGANEDALMYAQLALNADPENREVESLIGRLSRSVANSIQLPAMPLPASPLPSASSSEKQASAEAGSAETAVPANSMITSVTPAVNLPALPRPVETPLILPRNRFFGRTAEMEMLRGLIADTVVRLIALTGPGGGGKSRLAGELVRFYREEGAETLQIFTADLVAVRDAATAPATVAAALGLPGANDDDPVEQIAEAFNRETGPLLLVLDNADPLLPDNVEWIEYLLDHVPLLTVLTTSRTRLYIYGEQSVPIEPLAVPSTEEIAAAERPAWPLSLAGDAGDDEEAADLAALLTRCPSAALFVDRARHVRPAFRLTRRNAADILRLVTVLGGLPLSIELAAARVQVFTPARLLEQLPGRQLDLLQTGGAGRQAKDRHRSLRDTLAWSVDLLPSELRRAFARLSVFRGGFTGEAATAVLAGDAPLLDLERLCDASLITVMDSGQRAAASEGDDGMRFTMLEAVREYAERRLVQDYPAAENRDALERHGAFYEALADQIGPLLRNSSGGAEQAKWVRYLREEHDNLHVALDRAAGVETDGGAVERDIVCSPRRVLALTASLYSYWTLRGDVRHGRKRAEAALSRPQRFVVTQGEEALPPRRLVSILTAVGILAHSQGDLQTARLRYRQAVWITRRYDSDAHHRMAALWNNLGSLASDDGKLAEAVRWCQAALAAWQKCGDKHHESVTLYNIAEITARRGDVDAAFKLFAETADMASAQRDRFTEGICLSGMGEVLLARREACAAEEHLRKALHLFHLSEDTRRTAETLLTLGIAAAQRKDGPRAAWLMASAEAALKMQGVPLQTFALDEYKRLGWAIGSNAEFAEPLEPTVLRVLHGAVLSDAERHNFLN